MPPWEFEKLITEKRTETLKALREKSLEESARLTCEYEATAAGDEEHEVDTVFGAPVLPTNLLIDNVTGWFEEKGLHDVNMQALKMFEEAGEICHQLTRGDTYSKELVDALGDTIVTIIGLCHHLNIPFETALSLAWNEIKDRKGKVVNGSFVKEKV